MDYPQIILIAWFAVGLTAHCINHGKPKKAAFDLPMEALDVAVLSFVLYLGGFWS